MLIRTHRVSFQVLCHKEWISAWNSDQQPRFILSNKSFQQLSFAGLQTVPSTNFEYGQIHHNLRINYGIHHEVLHDFFIHHVVLKQFFIHHAARPLAILDIIIVFPSQFHVLDSCSVTPAFVPMAQRSLEQLTLSQAMDAALTQEGAQPAPVIAAVAETKDPLDLGPSQALLRIQSSMGQESQEVSRTGDARDNAKTKPVACMPK